MKNNVSKRYLIIFIEIKLILPLNHTENRYSSDISRFQEKHEFLGS